MLSVLKQQLGYIPTESNQITGKKLRDMHRFFLFIKHNSEKVVLILKIVIYEGEVQTSFFRLASARPCAQSRARARTQNGFLGGDPLLITHSGTIEVAQSKPAAALHDFVHGAIMYICGNIDFIQFIILYNLVS